LGIKPVPWLLLILNLLSLRAENKVFNENLHIEAFLPCSTKIEAYRLITAKANIFLSIQAALTRQFCHLVQQATKLLKTEKMDVDII
jgi:hypothetical protein